MKTVKRIRVPFIEGLENMTLQELDLAMEKSAAKFAVCENNWPKEAPYTPDCNGSIARTASHLAVMFHVRGLDLRATQLEDNGRSWEDSCCEFFVTDPYDGTYYNFELTCIGSLLSSKRKSRLDSVLREKEDVARVIRHSSLAHEETEISDRIFSWTVAMLIPYDLIGIDRDNVPVSVRGNFYKCGDLTAHPHFLSWNPIGTPKPDFHRPEYFGELILR
ncbi:MAG: carbohydrate-binding family 9-like protein [Bacteroidales bacterium]|uniref:carbohydrate-binding family 9-like protein n=1 Tax=Candidatus Cryptobacteroides sp. TaxID=2952915 RepID=UPI002A6EC5C2|nr:carbohydrate-binding family 9-like protein [Candidatus Cryptobacteroides sp.]MDD5914603.1 carbohydrate-binding family 9-like protein [Bacteroidales bacterium]MDD6829474.1 carbohydrate-binding family 9-like protein [Bacteroidales bacterium]MDD7235515.1 carbohydrate-binding family 9-like protein [Bacteroidales bacterium]MDY2700988.1 carbohydrate-binding family 9-like protein [Candidatus Cryptobacteroides sp.]MDY5566582.1 carbohydrate-binding family 9-like protein [Candidatus Cryptobacteroides